MAASPCPKTVTEPYGDTETLVTARRKLEMNFVTIILAVITGGAAAGLLGMLLAVPAAACVRILWGEVLEPKLASHDQQSQLAEK